MGFHKRILTVLTSERVIFSSVSNITVSILLVTSTTERFIDSYPITDLPPVDKAIDTFQIKTPRLWQD
jgi:hypothetical protein